MGTIGQIPEMPSASFASKVAARTDWGLGKHLRSLLLEPENPFDPRQRRPVRRSTGTLWLLALCAAGLALYFHTLH